MQPLALLGGAAMPAIGYGTWRCDKQLLKDAVVCALKAGCRHLDCASLYMNEEVIGEAIAQCIADGDLTREDLFVTTKLMPTDMHVETARQALQLSLDKLRLDYVDLYLLHWPFRFHNKPDAFPVPVHQRLGYSPEETLAVWRILEAAVGEGKVRRLGVSNFSRKKLAALWEQATIKPVNNQLELHPFLAQPDVLAWHRERGIVLTGYCPLGSPSRPPTFRHGEGEPECLTHPIITGIAAAHGKTPAQVLLKWAIQRGTVPLPKSTTPARIIENMGGADPSWALTEEDMELIAGLDQGYRYCRGENFAVEGQSWQQLWDEDV